MLKKGTLQRPYTGSKTESNEVVDLGISGKKISKEHKLPEKYQVSLKPNFKPMSPNKQRDSLSKTTTEALDYEEKFERYNQSDLNYRSDKPVNQFKTYMEVKMVNPELKPIYKDVNVKENDQLKKIASKPFSTARLSSSSSKSIPSTSQNSSSQRPLHEKQIDPTLLQNNGSQVSSGSTKVSSNQSKNTHNQKLSQDLAGFEKELSVTNTVQSRNLNQPPKNKNPFKLTNILRVDSGIFIDQENNFVFKEEQWTIRNPQARQNLANVIQNRAGNIKILQQYVQEVNSKHQLPKNFSKVVQHTISKFKEQSETQSQADQSLSDSKMFEQNGFDIDESIRDLELELADKEIANQKQKLKKLNEMLEESVDQISNMSAEDFRQRALFLTDIGRQSMQKSRLHQENILPENNEDENEDSEDEKSDQVKQKSKSNSQNAPIIKKNIKLAWATVEEQMEIESKCNKLPEQGKQRLEELLEGIEDFNNNEEELKKLLNAPNPFRQENTSELDNKINDYLKEFEEQDVKLEEGILDMKVLPKDKNLRDEAAERILQQKLESVNDQLLKIISSEKSDQVDKLKVQGICERNRQLYDYTPSEFLNLKLREFNYVSRMEEEEKQLLEKLENEQEILSEISSLKQYYDEAIFKMKNIKYDQNDTIDQEEFKKIKQQIVSQRIHNIDEIQPDPLVENL